MTKPILPATWSYPGADSAGGGVEIHKPEPSECVVAIPRFHFVEVFRRELLGGVEVFGFERLVDRHPLFIGQRLRRLRRLSEREGRQEKKKENGEDEGFIGR
ncbi:MAG TPA: hypothetical protein VFZ23_05480 [Pyrinomonadaceae bacterium]